MYIGGSIGFTIEETGFIQGIGKHTSFPMIPDLKILLEKIDTASEKVPKITDTLNIELVQEIAYLTEGSSTFKPRYFSGFASSVIMSEEIIQLDTLYKGLVLDYSTRQDMSATLLEKLAKTQVLYPNSIKSMVDQIRALQILASFFFGNLMATSCLWFRMKSGTNRWHLELN